MSFNPFWRLHYCLTGRRKTLMLYCGLFAVLVGFLWYLTYRINVGNSTAELERNLVTPAQLAAKTSGTTLLWVGLAQAAFALLMAPFAIRKAIAQDAANGMLESHELTPLSGVRIVLGYLTGPPIHSWLLFAVGIVLGVIMTVNYSAGLGALSTQAVTAWFGTQGVLLTLSLLYCTATILLSLHSPKRSAASPFLLVFLLPIFIGVSPGVSLLIGGSAVQVLMSVLGRVVPMAAPPPMSETFIFSALLQIAFALLFVLAASRKIRTNRATVFSVDLGLIFLGLFGVASVAGMYVSNYKMARPDDIWQVILYLIGTALLMMLLAYYPLRAAAVRAVLNLRRSAATTSLKQLPALGGVCIAIVLFISVTILGCARMTPDAWEFGIDYAALLGHGALPIAIVATVLFDVAILFWSIRRGSTGIGLIVLVVLVLRCAPFAIDVTTAFVRRLDADSVGDFPFMLSTGSPYATVIMSIVEADNLWFGVGFQVLLTLFVLGFVFFRSTIPNAKPALPA